MHAAAALMTSCPWRASNFPTTRLAIRIYKPGLQAITDGASRPGSAKRPISKLRRVLPVHMEGPPAPRSTNEGGSERIAHAEPVIPRDFSI